LLQAMEYANLSASQNEEMASLYEDLMVFHIELELQHDELFSAREETEQLLRENFAAFELAPLYYWKVDEQGMVHQWNLLGAECFGQSRQNLLPGRVPLGLVVDVEHHPGLQKFLQEIFRQPQAVRTSLRNRRGSELILLGRGLPETNPPLAMVAGVPPVDSGQLEAVSL
jgi:PAS domain-containing protein